MTCTAFNCSFLLVCFCFYLSKAKRTLLCQGAICGQLPALSVFIEMDGWRHTICQTDCIMSSKVMVNE